ncbi:sialin-like [Octopus bimaculoides]|uniref:sialin-like n=1 Tax=Octopus bimaculoides TaxID=37653 RepID=UPI0022E0E017|nr:sialin-like [Octopus bimaculoides]
MAFVCMSKTPNRTSEEVNISVNNEHCSGADNYSRNQNFEGEFEWSATLQSNMLAGYFYGYIMSNILGGLLADKYGGKRVVAGSLILASLLSVLHPSLSRISGYITLVLRILTGMVSGPIYPAIHSLFRRTFVGHSVSGFLSVYGFDNGWGSIFYVFGGLSLLFSCVWFYVVYDNPDTHPTISDEERSYLNTTVTSKKAVKNVPWKKLFSSPAVWAINFAKCDQTILISFLLFLCGVTMSFVCGGVHVNNKDIAPKYAGTVYGIANSFGTIASSICPLSTKALTPNGTKEEWQIVFALLAAICVSGAILYSILARGEIQDWASSEEPGSSVNHSDTQTNKIA